MKVVAVLVYGKKNEGKKMLDQKKLWSKKCCKKIKVERN